MPILNPQQAYNILVCNFQQNKTLVHFLISLMPIASKNIHTNRHMEEVHHKFTNFIIHNCNFFSTFFNISANDIKKIIMTNTDDFYKAILDIYNSSVSQDTKELKNEKKEQTYLSLKLACFHGYNINVDIPETESYFYCPHAGEEFSLFISNLRLAVIKDIRSSFDNNTFNRIILISYLLEASGYYIVFCIYSNQIAPYFINIIKQGLFSETHIFTDLLQENVNIDILSQLNDYKYGYIYLYVHLKYIDEHKKRIKALNNKYFKIFIISKILKSKNISDSIFYSNGSFIENYSKFIPEEKDLSGFSKYYLPINLCNVALYSSNDRKNDWTPVKISEIAYGTINANDFKYNKYQRIPIKIENDTFYIEFCDLHYMNLELYVPDPIYLTKKNFNISVVEKILDTYNQKTTISEKRKVKNSNINSNISEKMHNAFHYIHKYCRNDKNQPIVPYSSQIFAVYQAISYLTKSNYSKEKNDKGVILQVNTGEGKSYIIQALAEHLARQGNVVHVVTSNIILAARDFEKAYNYYRNCERKAATLGQKQMRPSILIHKSERKYIDKFLNKKKNEYEMTIDEEEYNAFYADYNFENSTSMNISVCLNDKNVKSNIIYSTFLNFEALYLSQNEKDSYFESKHLNNSYLIIDEADTILIDEIKNGTILAKPMKSNAIEALKFIYEKYWTISQDKDVLLKLVKQQFSLKDITVDDIERIIEDIKKVNSTDFGRNKTYVISHADKFPKKKGYKISDEQPRRIKKIVTFNSGNKGIAEPNKIYNGFIHQLIGIKEKYDHKSGMDDLEIEPLSMNYLFLSHPIYVKMYKGVCGVTGTIGSKKDKEIFKTYYGLFTDKVPRHQMNLRCDLPLIICKDIEERNERICQEISAFHKNQYPILAVFNNLNDIDIIESMLTGKYKIEVENIKKFDGSGANNEMDKNILEKESGKPNSITLGTNYCGRGVNIDYLGKPLCVIVSYYSEDKRSINQVLGRAGRNGKPGISRIICIREQYSNGGKSFQRKDMESILTKFDIKKDAQIKFITLIKNLHPWIFDESQYKEKIDRESAKDLRKCNLNVNRITAYKWKFPLCMSINTFLNIQTQRIFSLRNCPECKYTWNLFRIYMRELVLESWSLFLDYVDKNYEKQKEEKTYIKFFNEEYANYINTLFHYIPKEEGYSVFDTFLYIHNVVVKDWNYSILNNFPESFRKKSQIKTKDNSFTSFKFGFFPMSLKERSGTRITEMTDEEQAKSDKGQVYIMDPELRYIKNKNSIFSITKYIDVIFEKFQEMVDDKLLGLFGIRFFLRRTLAGCELGVCLDPQYTCELKYYNCLMDQDPLLMLTICTKSTFFWLAGIIIALLIFTITISVVIIAEISPAKIGQTAVNFIKKIFKGLGSQDDSGNGPIINCINGALDKIIQKLQKSIRKNVQNRDKAFGPIIDTLLNMFVPIDSDNLDDKINSKVFLHMKINENVRNNLKGILPFGKFLKIGILLIIQFALFISNFKCRARLKFEKKSLKIANTFYKDRKKHDYSQIGYYESYTDTLVDMRADLEEEYLENID